MMAGQGVGLLTWVLALQGSGVARQGITGTQGTKDWDTRRGLQNVFFIGNPVEAADSYYKKSLLKFTALAIHFESEVIHPFLSKSSSIVAR